MSSLNSKFPKSARLRKRPQFLDLRYNGRKFFGESVIIDFFFQDDGRPRLGITASRHFGKAHKRNSFKRIVREAFRQCQHLLPEGLDINVKPRNNIKNFSIEGITKDLKRLV